MKKIPMDLKKNGAAFWKAANAETIFEDAHDIARLLMAAKILDEIAEAEAAVADAGMIILDRYGRPKEHPAVKIIRDDRILFCRIIRELALDIITPDEPRLPR